MNAVLENREGDFRVPGTPHTRLLRLKEAAQLVGVSEKTLHRYIRERDFPCFRIGRVLRFSPGDVFRWLEARKEDA